MTPEDVNKLKAMLRAPHMPSERVAFKSEDGNLYEVTGSSDNGFTTRGFHYVSFSKVELDQFCLVPWEELYGH